VEGVSTPYWVLWINTVLDAIDLDRSDITEIAPNLRRVSRRQYREDLIGKHAMFRLPMIYGEPDHVTDVFKRVVEKNGLTTFSFWDRTKPGRSA